MIKRVVTIAGNKEISLQQCLLIIKGEDGSETIPIENVDFLLIENPRMQINGYVMNLLSSLGIIIVICDDCHMPSSIVFPLEGNCKQGAILRHQISVADKLKNDLWNQIIYHKLLNQRDVLKLAGCEMSIFKDFLTSNQPSSIEEQASEIYFKCLFGAEFKRNRNKRGINCMLNYGYSILRALVARQVVSSGMYFGIGINHHSQSDAFPLVNDLIEPFRPIVDRFVFLMTSKGKYEVDADVRNNLIEIIYETVYINGVEHTIQDAISLYISSFVDVLTNKRKILFCPSIIQI